MAIEPSATKTIRTYLKITNEPIIFATNRHTGQGLAGIQRQGRAIPGHWFAYISRIKYGTGSVRNDGDGILRQVLVILS